MRAKLTVLLAACCVTRAFSSDITEPFDALSKHIKVTESGNWIYVQLQALAPTGPRILRTSTRGPMPYTSDDRVLLEYFFIWDVADPHSKRSNEPITVSWKIMKLDWNKWHEEKKPLFIVQRETVALTAEDIELIKRDW
jgi:hypothetical protein